jgi:7,8-dihydropterin-6-yl-methyl-4-(beta-D-ribofuranosyl)aminobenzene 5'-phosphate synthase
LVSRTASFGETQDVAVTVLVDNHADLIVKSTETVKYFTDKPLLAEHGFAALIDLKEVGVKILWDAGVTPGTLMENVARTEIDLSQVDQIVLSHGHRDHTAAVSDVLEAIDVWPKPRDWEEGTSMEEMQSWAEGRRVPLIAHPAAFRERWGKKKEGGWFGPVPPPPRVVWEAMGAEIILSEGPYELGPGCWTTGYVPRRSFEHSGISKRLHYRQGDALVRDETEEDQALVINVSGKGLVVVSGCAHAGIVNTVNYAREISSVERVWAVLGGFHRARSTDEEVERTVEEIRALDPALVVPSHCTGFPAMCRFAAQLPESFVLGVVGTTYLF